VNEVAILLNRWQQYRVLALQWTVAGKGSLVGKGGGRKGVLLSSLFHPPAPGCCNADLGGLLQSRGRDSSGNDVVVVVHTINFPFPLKKK
jgi:hypothetical protein